MNNIEFYFCLFLENLLVVGRKFILLLDVNALNPCKQMVLLIPLFYLTYDVNLNIYLFTMQIEFKPPEKHNSNF